MTNHRRQLDPRYAAGEFFWYLNKDGSLAHIQHYANQYINFAEPSGIIHGAYGPRLAVQIESLTKLLEKDRTTRRAVIALYNTYDINFGDHKKDIPCTLTWNFLFENDRLCLIANMRSNDIWLGMPYDIFVNTCLQRLIAANIGVEVGWYQHQAANLHLYTKNSKAASEAMLAEVDYRDCWSQTKDSFCSQSDIDDACICEERYRTEDIIVNPKYRGFLSDLFTCIVGDSFNNKVLEDAYYRRK